VPAFESDRAEPTATAPAYTEQSGDGSSDTRRRKHGQQAERRRGAADRTRAE